MKSVKRLLIGVFLLIIGIAMFGFGILFGRPDINIAGMVIFGLGFIYGIFGIFSK